MLQQFGAWHSLTLGIADAFETLLAGISAAFGAAPLVVALRCESWTALC